MTISERIFERLSQLSMTQKEFLLEPAFRERMMGYAEAYATLHESGKLVNSVNTDKKGTDDQ